MVLDKERERERERVQKLRYAKASHILCTLTIMHCQETQASYSVMSWHRQQLSKQLNVACAKFG